MSTNSTSGKKPTSGHNLESNTLLTSSKALINTLSSGKKSKKSKPNPFTEFAVNFIMGEYAPKNDNTRFYLTNIMPLFIKYHAMILFFEIISICAFIMYLVLYIWYLICKSKYSSQYPSENHLNQCIKKITNGHKLLFFILTVFSIISSIFIGILIRIKVPVHSARTVYLVSTTILKFILYVLVPFIFWILFPKHPGIITGIGIVYSLFILISSLISVLGIGKVAYVF